MTINSQVLFHIANLQSMNEFETEDGVIGDGATRDQNHELGLTKELK